MKGLKLVLCVLMLVAVFSLGCETKGPITGCPDEPEWLSRGAGIYPGDKGRALYAIGIAEHDPNERMMNTVAMQSARTEIANQMEVYVASLVKDFMQSHKDFVSGEGSSIQFTSAVSKAVTEKTLYGSQRIDSWRHCNGKKLYVLVTMPVGEALEQAKNDVMAKAREKAAETFKQKADEALAELDKELTKRQMAEQAGQ